MKKIFILYSLFLSVFSIFSYTFVDPNLIYLKSVYTGFAFNKRFITTIFYTFFIISFFVFYFLFLSLLAKNKLSLKNIKFLIGITCGILLLSYPAMLSYDIFNYIFTAKVLYLYKENPYIIMPIEFVQDPLLLFTHAANKTALYGYLWVILTAIPYFLSFGNFILMLFNFKLLVLLFYLGMISLIWKISRNLFSVLFFALNPLVIIETLIGGHNDVAMMFLALFSFYLIMRKRIIMSIIFLVVSILIKYSTLFLVPVFIYVLWKIHIKDKINWQFVFYISSFSMMVIFFFSPLREEIYPWYAIWFLTFLCLIPEKKFILYTSLVFSFSLLLRYIPFMLTGTYLGYTQVVKTIISFTPPGLFAIYYGLKKKI